MRHSHYASKRSRRSSPLVKARCAELLAKKHPPIYGYDLPWLKAFCFPNELSDSSTTKQTSWCMGATNNSGLLRDERPGASLDTGKSNQIRHMHRIIDVPPGAAEALEQLGSKHAVWLTLENYGRVLFKPSRANTGEHWAEKIACEVASLLGLPRALYELARCGERSGVISVSLVDRGARLIHGNELLASVGAEVSENKRAYRRSDNSLRRVIGYFRAAGSSVLPPYGHPNPEGVNTALDVFTGYLMFDALIANQDRHEQNWAVLRSVDGQLYLAPTYDHGSSLGRNESDERRKLILTTRDKQQDLNAYARRARSAFFSTAKEGARPILAVEAFLECAKHAPLAANAWLARLSAIDQTALERVVGEIPSELISLTARKFAVGLMLNNRDRLLGMGD